MNVLKRRGILLMSMLLVLITNVSHADFFKQLKPKVKTDTNVAVDAVAPFMGAVFTGVLIFAAILLVIWLVYFGKDMYKWIKGSFSPGWSWVIKSLLTLVGIAFMAGGAVWNLLDFADSKIMDPADDIINGGQSRIEQPADSNLFATYDQLLMELKRG